MPKENSISVRFVHGLGDCVHFAHLVALYAKRGWSVEIECEADKAILFQAAGARIVANAENVHPWRYPRELPYAGHGRLWEGSKLAGNISRAPLPHIGEPSQLWAEYCDVRLDLSDWLGREERDRVRRFLDQLPRPIILLHTTCGSSQARKSLPKKTTDDLCKKLLDETSGSILFLDWHDRPLPFSNFRLRHLADFGECNLATLALFQAEADLMVGVDSGPLHLARCSALPCVGVWAPDFYPARYTVPRSNQLNVVCADWAQQWSRYKRVPFNLVELPGAALCGQALANYIVRMIAPARYGKSMPIARDVQIQWFVNQLLRNVPGNNFCGYIDRWRSIDALLLMIGERFKFPLVVETGTIRAVDDWSAGFFTYIMGTYLSAFGGLLFSADIDESRCNFARTWSAVFEGVVTVEVAESVAFLTRFPGSIDVLYLDSLDTDQPGHAEHCLDELRAALPKLRKNSLVMIDDTPFERGRWIGKGALTVPFLLDQGWKILFAGYQVLLSR